MAGVLGWDQLRANFLAFPRELQKQVLEPAIRKAIAPMRDTAEALAPKRTGHLAMSIVVAKDRRPEMANVDARYVGFVRYKGPEAALYWRYVEFGTSTMPPHPFMRPAFEINVMVATQIFAAEVTSGAQRVLAKYGR